MIMFLQSRLLLINEVDAETNNMHRTWIQLIHELAIMEEDFNVAFNKREYISKASMANISS
jgi:hypothetical protein